MAYEEPVTITDPSQIEEGHLSTRLSNLSIKEAGSGSEPHLPTPHIKLVLLQPLATPAILAACRNPLSAFTSLTVDSGDGNITTAPGNEYLDITVLDKAWRKAIGKALPVSFITFDLSLSKPDPRNKPDGRDAFQNIYWDVSPPYGSTGPCILTRDVMRLVITIATTTRMRTPGNLDFDVVCEEKSRGSSGAITLLKRQLRAIAESRRPRRSEAVESNTAFSMTSIRDD
ncbi:hypothetical protein LZ30DRAFT_310468 [Colletotrichum cereale]|nr:hypothetical protein LZ30DRAFT_310468 [Colletotrichum cereale]